MNAQPLWDHQKRAIALAEKQADLALFMEMGTGKTRTTIEILRRRFQGEKRVMRTLILGPKVVAQNWRNEIKLFSKIDPKEVVILEGSGKKRAKTFTDATLDAKTTKLAKGKIIITNYESMQMEDLVELILSWQPEILICDESHRCKDHSSKRARKIVKIAKQCKHRYILTGTPILNSAMDVFNQYLILDGGKTFGDNPMAFRWRYFEDQNQSWAGSPGYFPKFAPRPETYAEMNDKIYSKAIRVVKSECLDLPPLVREIRDVTLSPEQTRMYKEMREEYLTYVEGLLAHGEKAAVVAQLAITKALRLQQIVTGFAKTEHGSIYRIKENPRLDEVHDLLEEIVIGQKQKVIVWAIFKENYQVLTDLCSKLKLQYAEIHGNVDDKDKAEKFFRRDESCRVMVANQRAGGIGINLTEAPYSIFFSRNFSLADDLQAEARNYRGGSEMHEKVTRVDLRAPGTIDELLAEALASKQEIAHHILDWGKRL